MVVASVHSIHIAVIIVVIGDGVTFGGFVVAVVCFVITITTIAAIIHSMIDFYPSSIDYVPIYSDFSLEAVVVVPFQKHQIKTTKAYYIWPLLSLNLKSQLNFN